MGCLINNGSPIIHCPKNIYQFNTINVNSSMSFLPASYSLNSSLPEVHKIGEDQMDHGGPLGSRKNSIVLNSSQVIINKTHNIDPLARDTNLIPNPMPMLPLGPTFTLLIN